MARPCKSAKVLTDKSQTKAEINARIEMEDSRRRYSAMWLICWRMRIFSGRSMSR